MDGQLPVASIPQSAQQGQWQCTCSLSDCPVVPTTVSWVEEGTLAGATATLAVGALTSTKDGTLNKGTPRLVKVGLVVVPRVATATGNSVAIGGGAGSTGCSTIPGVIKDDAVWAALSCNIIGSVQTGSAGCTGMLCNIVDVGTSGATGSATLHGTGVTTLGGPGGEPYNTGGWVDTGGPSDCNILTSLTDLLLVAYLPTSGPV